MQGFFWVFGTSFRLTGLYRIDRDDLAEKKTQILFSILTKESCGKTRKLFTTVSFCLRSIHVTQLRVNGYERFRKPSTFLGIETRIALAGENARSTGEFYYSTFLGLSNAFFSGQRREVFHSEARRSLESFYYFRFACPTNFTPVCTVKNNNVFLSRGRVVDLCASIRPTYRPPGKTIRQREPRVFQMWRFLQNSKTSRVVTIITNNFPSSQGNTRCRAKRKNIITNEWKRKTTLNFQEALRKTLCIDAHDSVIMKIDMQSISKIVSFEIPSLRSRATIRREMC